MTVPRVYAHVVAIERPAFAWQVDVEPLVIELGRRLSHALVIECVQPARDAYWHVPSHVARDEAVPGSAADELLGLLGRWMPHLDVKLYAQVCLGNPGRVILRSGWRLLR